MNKIWLVGNKQKQSRVKQAKNGNEKKWEEKDKQTLNRRGKKAKLKME